MRPSEPVEPSRATDAPPGNLWVPLTRLLGRDAALTELVALLWDARLLVLCGPGGVGKSRLALALAESVRGDLIGGAWWVDLSSTFDPGLVARQVADAVLPGAAASDPVAAIARELNQPALVVLDNAEQVSEACAALAAELLARVSQLRLVVTSRQTLGVPGEQVWRWSGAIACSTRTSGACWGAWERSAEAFRCRPPRGSAATI